MSNGLVPADGGRSSNDVGQTPVTSGVETLASGLEEAPAIEIFFVVQGQRQPFAEHVHSTITVAEFTAIAAPKGNFSDVVSVFVEDVDEPLGEGLALVEHLSREFSLLHVAHRHAKIAVTVEFNMRKITREFRPNATAERVVRWVISPEGFDLTGPPSDFQLKHDGEVLPPDTHIGQIPHPHHAMTLALVFKVKPQGGR
jgi:hypothetical protein